MTRSTDCWQSSAMALQSRSRKPWAHRPGPYGSSTAGCAPGCRCRPGCRLVTRPGSCCSVSSPAGRASGWRSAGSRFPGSFLVGRKRGHHLHMYHLLPQGFLASDRTWPRWRSHQRANQRTCAATRRISRTAPSACRAPWSRFRPRSGRGGGSERAAKPRTRRLGRSAVPASRTTLYRRTARRCGGG